MSVPHHVVDIIVKIPIIVRVNADAFVVTDVGIQLTRFSVFKEEEFSQIEDIPAPIVLTHHRDLPSKIFLDVGDFGTFSDPLYVETALIAQKHISKFVRVPLVPNHEIPRHIVAVRVAVPFCMTVNHMTANRYLSTVVVAGILMDCPYCHRLQLILSNGNR